MKKLNETISVPAEPNNDAKMTNETNHQINQELFRSGNFTEIGQEIVSKPIVDYVPAYQSSTEFFSSYRADAIEKQMIAYLLKN